MHQQNIMFQVRNNCNSEGGKNYFLLTPQGSQNSSPVTTTPPSKHQKVSPNSLKYSYGLDKIATLCNEKTSPSYSKKKSTKEQRTMKKDPYIHLIKACTREEIWPMTKFLDDEMISKMKMEDHPRFKNSAIGKLLKRCMLEDLEPIARLQFWKRYSQTVKEELNKMKTNCCKQMKIDVKNGTVAIVMSF